MNSETIELAEYYNIIACLIEKHCFNSIFKIEVTALMIRHYKENNFLKKTETNLIKVFFSSFLTVLYSRSGDLKTINEIINILEKCNYLKVKEDFVLKKKELPCVYDDFISKKNVAQTINLINDLSIESFVEDLITYA